MDLGIPTSPAAVGRSSNKRGNEAKEKEEKTVKKDLKGKGKAAGGASASKPTRKLTINTKAVKRKSEDTAVEEEEEEEEVVELPAKRPARGGAAGKTKGGAVGKAKGA